MISFNVQLSGSQSRTKVIISSLRGGGDIVTEKVSPRQQRTWTNWQKSSTVFCKTQYILEFLLYLIVLLLSLDS